MKIVTIAALKGGLGKTTILYNFGEYLSSEDNKVLLIDTDHQCSLTKLYGLLSDDNSVEENLNTSVKNIYEESDYQVKLHKINENLYVVSSYPNLDDVEARLQTSDAKNFFMWDWLDNNYDELSQFDYILIDSHPDFGTITKNSVVVSDIILSFIDPSEFGYENKNMFPTKYEIFRNDRSNIDRKTKESLVTAKLLFIANMIKHNTRSSKDLLEVIKDEEDVILKLPYKEILNQTTLNYMSISKMKKSKQWYKLPHKKTIDELLNKFEELKNVIDKEVE